MGDEPARPSWLYLATPGEGAVLEEGDDGIGAASRAFSFPYPAAYRIQIDLMQAVFRAIEDGKVGRREVDPLLEGLSQGSLVRRDHGPQKGKPRSSRLDDAGGEANVAARVVDWPPESALGGVEPKPNLRPH